MPEPRKGEKYDDFIERCMGDDESRKTFPREDQRRAFCEKQWEGRDRSKQTIDILENLLTVPAFPRLEEYFGLWLMESRAFEAHWQAALRMDLQAHVQEPQVVVPTNFETVQVQGKQLAIIKAMGTLMKQQPSMGGTSTVALRRQIRQAAADRTVSGILLHIDSPGGSVSGIDELAQEVRRARRQKPLWAFIDDLGASAAYYVASQAEQVYANNKTALIGSIGTILTVYDVSAMAEREGIKALVFATGSLKGAGVRGTPVTEEQQAYFQGLIDSAQESFDTAVRTGRKLTPMQMSDVRSGAVFPALIALEKRLIDGIRGLEQTIEALASQR